MSDLQYMALSSTVYNDLPTGPHVVGSISQPWTILELIKAGEIEGAEFDGGTNSVVMQKPELSALNSMLDWTLVAYQPNTASSFSGAAFQDPISGEIVFAFRGTEGFSDVGDLVADINITIPNSSTTGPNQFNDGYTFWSSVMAGHSGASYSFTGHSLGGGIAQYMTYRTNEVGNSVTFNAVGIGQELDVDPTEYNDSITDYVNENDLIGEYGIQLGTTIYKQDTNSTRLFLVDPDAMAKFLAVRVAINKGLISGDQGAILLNLIQTSTTIQTEIAINSIADAPAHPMDQMLVLNTTTGQYEMTANANSSNVSLVAQVLGGGAFLLNMVGELEELGADVIAAGINTAAHVVINVIDTASATAEQSLAIANQVEQILENAGTTVINWISALLGSIVGDTFYISGTDGNDGISGLAGRKNIIYGLSSADSLSGQDNDDRIFGGSGSDIIIGGWGADVLVGGAGNDSLYGDQDESTGAIYYSVPKEDVLDGGVGNDYLAGGGGNDKYIFRLGDGQDIIDDKSRSYNYDSFGSGGDADTLAFQAGINPSNVVVTRGQYDLYLNIAGTTDKVTIQNYFVNTSGTIEQITFADGTIWSEAAIREKARYIEGTSSDNVLQGFYDQSDIIHGYAGNDNINASSGDDFAFGGDGDDIVIGEAGADTLVGGAGNDSLYGGSQTSQDSFFGPVYYNDLLDGGSGNDTLEGGSGDDTYVFGKGYGNDTIHDFAYDVVSSNNAGFDTIQFLSSVSPGDVSVHRGMANPYDLIFKIIDTNETITVKDFFTNNGFSRVEQATFTDGTVWDLNAILEKARTVNGSTASEIIDVTAFYDQNNIVYAGAGDDTVTASNGNDLLMGEGGNDTLVGGYGSDILDGGTGNDTMNGGVGNDTYKFGIGYGQDTIHEEITNSNEVSGADTVQFLNGLTPDDIGVFRIGSDLEFRIKNTSDVLRVQNHFGSSVNAVENVVFTNGVSWDLPTISQKAVVLGSAGDDSLSGDGQSNTLKGLAGNDTLYGGSGDDTYVFALGDGQDTIYEESGTDTIQFASGISPEDVTVKRVERYGGNVTYYDLQISIAGSSDVITVQQYFGYSGWNGFNNTPNQMIEQITFADSTVWTQSTIYDKVHNLVGTSGSDNFVAYDNGNVNYQGLAGNDSLVGNVGNDTIDGGDGADYLSGAGGNDILLGGAGNDNMDGGSGNDIHNGGTGNDTSYDTGGGDDTYVFVAGDGQDTIYDYTGADTIQFGAGIDPDDIIAKRVTRTVGWYAHYDLELSIVGTNDKLTIQDYFGYDAYNGLQSGTNYMIEQFIFADSTVWTPSTIDEKMHNMSGTSGNDVMAVYDNTAATFYGLAGNDSLTGGGGNDMLDGGDGDDSIFGAAGADVLVGGAGVDSLDGGDGDDILTGGTGNDALYGGYSNDTYVFNPGDGQDFVYDYNGTDIAELNRNLMSVMFERVGNDLKVTMNGSMDAVTVGSWYNNDVYKVETFKASDGSTITSTQIEQLIQAMASFSTDNGMTWSQALDNQSSTAQSLISQYWTAPTV